MKTSHTPGPWKTQWNGVWKVATRAGFLVANISPPKNAHGVFEPANVEANARLIAAAPELLEALREMSRVFDYAIAGGLISGGTENSRIAQAAFDAIAKATQP